jgi:hypothetical protein
MPESSRCVATRDDSGDRQEQSGNRGAAANFTPASLYLINERKPVSPGGAAVRLGKDFDDGAGVWTRMQGAYDAWRAARRSNPEYGKHWIASLRSQ